MVDGMTNLEEEAATLLAERREHALTSRGGTAELISCAVDHLEVKYKEGRGENSSLPREDMEYYFIKFLETVAKGSFDRKRPGQEMTNGKGMTALENFGKVTSGMMDLYDPESEEYVWLDRETPKWGRLAEKVYVVHCF